MDDEYEARLVNEGAVVLRFGLSPTCHLLHRDDSVWRLRVLPMIGIAITVVVFPAFSIVSWLMTVRRQ